MPINEVFARLLALIDVPLECFNLKYLAEGAIVRSFVLIWPEFAKSRKKLVKNREL